MKLRSNFGLIVFRFGFASGATVLLLFLYHGEHGNQFTSLRHSCGCGSSENLWQSHLERRIAEAVRLCCPTRVTHNGSALESATPEDVTFYIPVQTGALAASFGRATTLKMSSIPMRHKRVSGTTGETGESLETIFPPNTLHVEGSRRSPSEGDEEEMERLQWERHPPMSPRGRMMQARQELAQELAAEQEEQSYWNIRPIVISAAEQGQENDLDAIAEESEEDASLRRNNSHSNRQTVASRQSSPRRPPSTALGILDESQGESQETKMGA